MRRLADVLGLAPVGSRVDRTFRASDADGTDAILFSCTARSV